MRSRLPLKNGEHNSEVASTLNRGLTHLPFLRMKNETVCIVYPLLLSNSQANDVNFVW